MPVAPDVATVDDRFTIQAVPEELLVDIFKRLKRPDLASVAATCKQWHRISLDPYLRTTLVLYEEDPRTAPRGADNFRDVSQGNGATFPVKADYPAPYTFAAETALALVHKYVARYPGLSSFDFTGSPITERAVMPLLTKDVYLESLIAPHFRLKASELPTTVVELSLWSLVPGSPLPHLRILRLREGPSSPRAFLGGSGGSGAGPADGSGTESTEPDAMYPSLETFYSHSGCVLAASSWLSGSNRLRRLEFGRKATRGSPGSDMPVWPELVELIAPFYRNGAFALACAQPSLVHVSLDACDTPATAVFSALASQLPNLASAVITSAAYSRNDVIERQPLEALVARASIDISQCSYELRCAVAELNLEPAFPLLLSCKWAVSEETGEWTKVLFEEVQHPAYEFCPVPVGRVVGVSTGTGIPAKGVTKFCGKIEGKEGFMCGIVMAEPDTVAGFTLRDGEFEGTRYFNAPPNSTVFVPSHQVSLNCMSGCSTNSPSYYYNECDCTQIFDAVDRGILVDYPNEPEEDEFPMDVPGLPAPPPVPTQSPCPLAYLGCTVVLANNEVHNHLNRECEFYRIDCSHCGNSFVRGDFAQHFATVHINENDAWDEQPCPNAMKGCMGNHTGRCPDTEYVCTGCDYVASSLDDLRHHQGGDCLRIRWPMAGFELEP